MQHPCRGWCGDLCRQKHPCNLPLYYALLVIWGGTNSEISLILDWKCVRIWKAINFMHNMVPLNRWCFSRWIIFKIWVLPNLLWLQKWFKIDIEHLKCIKSGYWDRVHNKAPWYGASPLLYFPLCIAICIHFYIPAMILLLWKCFNI